MFVIKGDVQGLRVSAGRLRERGMFFADVSRALAAVGVSGWSGTASDMFRERFRVEPSRWGEASWAFERAGEALDEYADVLERCQAAAAECERRYAYGVELNAEASADWRSAPVVSRGGLVMPKRPGDGVMAGAERDFARVVADLNTAGDECARALRVACANAPQERSWWDEAGAFAQGALEAAVEYAKLVMWPMTGHITLAGQACEVWRGKLTLAEAASLQIRPIEMMGDLAQAGWNDPRGTGLAALAGALDVQTWIDDPARAAGRLAPDAIIGAATGGVGAAAHKMGKLGLKANQIHAGAKTLNHVHDFPLNRPTTSFPEFRTPRPSTTYSENVTASGVGVKHALPQASHHPSPHLHAEHTKLPQARHPHPDPAVNQGHENPHTQGKTLFPNLEERLNPTPDHTPEPIKTDDNRTNSVTSAGLKDDVDVPAQREEPTKTNDTTSHTNPDTTSNTTPHTTSNTDTDTSSHTDTDTSSHTDSDPVIASDEAPATDADSLEAEAAEAPASTREPDADTPHTKETPDPTTPNNTDNAEHAKPEPKPASDSPTTDETPEPIRTDDADNTPVDSSGKGAEAPARSDESVTVNNADVERQPTTDPDTSSHTDPDTSSHTDSDPAIASDETPASDSTATPNEAQDTDTDSLEAEAAEAPASTGQPNADTPHTKETPDPTTPNNTDNAEHAKPEPKPALDEASDSVRADDVQTDSVTSEAVKDDVDVPAQREEPTKTNDTIPVEPRPNTNTTSHTNPGTTSNTDTDSDPAAASDETPTSDSTTTPNKTQDTDTDSPETETTPEAPASTGQPNADTPHTKETPDPTTPNNTEHAKPKSKPDSDSPTTGETSEPIRTDDADNNTVADTEKESGALAQTDGPSEATTDASPSTRDVNDAHPVGDNEANSIAANDQAKPSVDAGPANESAPAVAPLDGAESAPVYDPHSTQLSTLPTLKSEEEIAVLTRPNNISDANYALLRKDRGLAPTGPDSIERVLRHNWDESLPPEEIPQLSSAVRELINDIGEVFGRDEHGNLLSYNQWWDLHNGPRTFWPQTGMEVPHHPSQPEHLILAPGITEPPETHTFVGGAYKETVTDWGGPGVKAQEDDIIHVQGTAASLFNQFRTHYGLPEDSPVFFDRIGYDGGEYLALIGPEGPASVGARSIAPPSLMNPYTSFRVNEDNIPANWTMRSGITAPWHGGYGGATEILFFDEHNEKVLVKQLLKKGILRKVKVQP